MKLVTFSPTPKDAPRTGAIHGDKVVDLWAASGGKVPDKMLALIQAGGKALEVAKGAIEAADSEALYSLEKVKLRAPLPNPPALRDFFAFEDHAKAGAGRRKETLNEYWYELPVYYKGNHRQISGPGDEIPWPAYTRKLDFECEIAAVVGKQGTNLSPEDAAAHIFGYMIFNDWSARDIQKKEMLLRLGPAKGKDFANSFGPYLVTADEADPRRDFALTVKVNGEVWSQGHFKDQWWGFPLMVSHVSQAETVFPGDLMGSGTFHKGCGLDLDRWLKPGDQVELEVPILGTLSNRVGKPPSQTELNYRKAEAA